MDSKSESEKSEEGESFINHPFVVNQAKIVMNIPVSPNRGVGRGRIPLTFLII